MVSPELAAATACAMVLKRQPTVQTSQAWHTLSRHKVLPAQPPQLSVPPQPSGTLPHAVGAQVAGVQPLAGATQRPVTSLPSPAQHLLRFLLGVCPACA